MANSLFLAETRICDSARSLPPIEKWLHLVYEFAPPNKSLQGSEIHKVLGRGRFGGVLEQVVRARVLNRWRAAPELSRYAPGGRHA